MALAAPIILYPKTNWVSGIDELYYTDSLVQMISGEIPVVPAEVDAETVLSVQYRYKVDVSGITGTWSAYQDGGITVGETSTLVEFIPWSLNTDGIITLVAGSKLYLEFKTIKRSRIGDEVGPILAWSAASADLQVEIVSEQQLTASSTSPTGLDLKRSKDSIKIRIPIDAVVLSGNNTFAGCNFYVALVGGGGEDGYVRINTALVTDPDSVETVSETLDVSTSSDNTNDLTIVTTRNIDKDVEYYTYEWDKTTINRLIIEGKIPNIFLSDGQSLDQSRVYYFSTTVVSYDQVLNQSVESPYSIELEGAFVEFSASFLDLPQRNRDDVIYSVSRDMFINNNQVSVIAGSVMRDMLDPLALEFEKFYVIQDFVFACLSIDTLLIYDDANGDGVSDTVAENTRKRRLADALSITNEASVQNLIDEQFDKRAANNDLTRLPAQKAYGTVTFYTTTQPTEDILIPDGSIIFSEVDNDTGVPSVEFVVQGTKIIDADNSNIFYNPVTKRYETPANIVCRYTGERGNIASGKIKIITGLSPILRVENNAPTKGGTDKETNQQLAVRVKLAPSSYDAGTQNGYAMSSYSVPGVQEVRVEQYGDPLMMRDYDINDRKHIGGKVDVYIRGERIFQIVDQIAFKYEYPTDTQGNKTGEQFYVTDASEYRIRTNNTKVGVNNPIVFVHRVRNVTRRSDYDLVNLQIVGDMDTIVLASSLANKAIGMSSFDVIDVDYRYRSSNLLTLSNQPVLELVSVVDINENTIDPSKYTLVKLEDPLKNGTSSIAKDSVQFNFSDEDAITEFVPVTDEGHDMLLNTPAKINLKGVDISSIVVTDPVDTTITFKLDVDYSITQGSEIDFTYLNLLPNGKIRHGDIVNVSYDASMNFNVTYTVNSLIEEVQTSLASMKHSCADVIVKNAVGNALDLGFMVIARIGVDKTLLKSRLRTAVANYVNGLKMGDSFTQGALINSIRNVVGVKEISMPLTQMMKRNGSFIPLDDIGKAAFEVYQRTSRNGMTAYRSVNSVLKYKTSDNGGETSLFRAVYEDNIALEIMSSALDVSRGSGRAYIQSDGRIIVSTTDGYPPQSKYYKASYYSFYPANEIIVGDIETAQIEYLVVDELTFKGLEVIDEKIVKRGL